MMAWAWLALTASGCARSVGMGETLDAARDTRDAAVLPDIADVPEVRDAPDAPEVLEVPDALDVLDAPDAPDVSAMPDVRDVPDVVTTTAPRPIAPLSTATVTSRRPTLRWALPPGADGAHVEVCRDRACTTVLASFDAAGTSGAPAEDLPAGVVFWRLRGRAGGVTSNAASPVWQFTVGARSAPVDTSWGTTLDVNGDGHTDVIVGMFNANNSAGNAYLYLGSATSPATAPAATLSSPDGADGTFGCSVASAGDVNGDGYADVIVGAFGVGRDTGRAYLYLGSATGLGNAPAATLTGRDGPNGWFGISVASAGDVNGDGYADVLVGADGASTRAGAVYVYLGSATGLATTEAAVLDGPDGTQWWTAAGAGDVDGDGYADVIAGTRGDGIASPYGACVYRGSRSGLAPAPATTLATPVGLVGAFGTSVASAAPLERAPAAHREVPCSFGARAVRARRGTTRVSARHRDAARTRDA